MLGNCWGWWVTEAVTGVGPQVRSLPSHLHPYPYSPEVPSPGRSLTSLIMIMKIAKAQVTDTMLSVVHALSQVIRSGPPLLIQQVVIEGLPGILLGTRDTSMEKKKKTPPPKKEKTSPVSSWNSHTLPLLLLRTPCTKAPKAF